MCGTNVDSMLAVEAHDGRIYLHDNRGRFQETLVKEPVNEASRSGTHRCAMSWAPKPQRLYFANGNTVMTWDSSTKRTAESFEMASRINALAINSEDILLAVGQNTGSVDVVNRATGVSTKLETPKSLIMARLEYSTFNKSILGGVGNDGILRLWDTGSNGSPAIYHSFTPTHEVPISGMAFSPFNRYLICTAGLDKRYALYDVEKRNVVKNTVTDYALTSVAFKNDGISMAFGTDQGKVLLYDLRSTSRPISIVDTRVNAPVTAVHFQGKQQSASGSGSTKRHQTINGHALKRQNSAGSKTSIFSMKSSMAMDAGGTTTNASTGLGDANTGNLANSIPTRPAPIKTATLSYPALNQLTGNGTSYPTRVQSVGANSGKGIMELFSKQTTDSPATVTITSTTQEKTPYKPRRPSSSTGSSSANTKATLSSKPTTPSTAGPTSDGTTVGGHTSTPTTPSREGSNALGSGNNDNNSNSYPNSRTVSPFAFQVMQAHSPSDESFTSSSSVNTPPGSPGAAPTSMEPLSNSQSHLRHHHYQPPSADPTSKSPSRVSRAKRRKSFGTLLASGGVASMPGTPDNMFSEERMEVLRGQIVDRVRNVLLDQPADSTAMEGVTVAGTSGAMAATQDEIRTWQKPVVGSTVAAAQPRLVSKPKVPVKNLWLQVGQEDNGAGSSSRSLATASSSLKTSSKILAQSALSVSTSTPTSVPSSAAATESLQAGKSSTSSFPSKILEGVIDGCLMEFRAGIRNDIQNMHLELLRQFQIQKMEMEGLLKQYTDTKELKEENERLLEENRRLRMNY
ncbi:Protein nedd1 [Dissophora ornata]|nr:Protein nedd1 [Dissophora ornata]